jgi:nucleoside-triphosphatase THEP1
LKASIKNLYKTDFFGEVIKELGSLNLNKNQITEQLKVILNDEYTLQTMILCDKADFDKIVKETNNPNNCSETIESCTHKIRSIIYLPQPINKRKAILSNNSSDPQTRDTKYSDDEDDSYIKYDSTIKYYKNIQINSRIYYYIRFESSYYLVPKPDRFNELKKFIYCEQLTDLSKLNDPNLKFYNFKEELDNLELGFPGLTEFELIYYVLFLIKFESKDEENCLICYTPKHNKWFKMKFCNRYKYRSNEGVNFACLFKTNEFSVFGLMTCHKQIALKKYSDVCDGLGHLKPKLGKHSKNQINELPKNNYKTKMGLVFFKNQPKCKISDDINSMCLISKRLEKKPGFKGLKYRYRKRNAKINPKNVLTLSNDEKEYFNFTKEHYLFKNYQNEIPTMIKGADLLNFYRLQGEIPFNIEITDEIILEFFLNNLLSSESKDNLILEFFERTDWRLKDIDPVEKHSVFDVNLDIDSVVCEFRLRPISDLGIIEEESLKSILKFVDEEVFIESKMKSTFQIDLNKSPIISRGHTYKKDGKVFYQLYSNLSIIFNCKIRFLDKINNQVEIIKQTVKRASCYWLNYKQCETKAHIDEVSLGNNIYKIYGCPGFNLIVVLLISIKYEIEVCLENYNGKMDLNFGANSYFSTVNPSIENLINEAKKDYDKKVPELKSLIGYAILKFARTIKGFLHENKISSIVKDPCVYVGYGSKINLRDEHGEKLFAVANMFKNPAGFNYNGGFNYFNKNTEYSSLRFPDAEYKGFDSYQILGGFLNHELLPQNIRGGKYFKDENILTDTNIKIDDDIFRSQSYSPTFRYMSENSAINVINETLDHDKNILDFEKFRSAFENILKQFDINIQSLKEIGGEARLEIAKDISHQVINTNDPIESILKNDLFSCLEFTIKCAKGYRIKKRLELVQIFMHSLTSKVECLWSRLKCRPVHIDLYWEYVDLWNEIKSITCTFWNGRYPKLKPYLADVQIYIGRPILMPIGLENRSNDTEFRILYNEFLKHLSIHESKIPKPAFQMTLKQPKIKLMLKKSLEEKNKNLLACRQCQIIISDSKKKDNHICFPINTPKIDVKENKCFKPVEDCNEFINIYSEDSKNFISVDGEDFLNIHNEKINKLSDNQKEVINLCFKSHYILIVGQPGSGKTTLLKLILERLVRTRGNSKVLGFARDNDKAAKLSGKTFHSLFGFTPETNFEKNWTDNDIEIHVKNMSQNKLTFIQNLTFLGGDEISEISKQMFELADRISRWIRNRPDVPFGGIELVIVGDFFQLPPIASKEWGQFIFESKIIMENFSILYLNSIYRSKDDDDKKFLIDLRNPRLLKSINNDTIDSKFGSNVKLEHGLFVFCLLLECLLKDVNDTNKKTKNNYCIRYKQENLILENGDNYDLNLKGIVDGIRHLERICSNAADVSETNSKFFKDFPTTLCVENSEVNFLNSTINTRGADYNITYHHILISINGTMLRRTFYAGQNVIYINQKFTNKIFYNGKVIKINDDDKCNYLLEISVSVPNYESKIIHINQKDIAEFLYPREYFRCNLLPENQTEVHILSELDKTVYLREGQR